MKPVDLAKQCIDVINLHKQSGLEPILTLTTKRGNPRLKYRYPFGKKGPRGEIVGWGIPDGHDTVIFNAIDMLAYLVSSGIVKITETES